MTAHGEFDAHPNALPPLQPVPWVTSSSGFALISHDWTGDLSTKSPLSAQPQDGLQQSQYRDVTAVDGPNTSDIASTLEKTRAKRRTVKVWRRDLDRFVMARIVCILGLHGRWKKFLPGKSTCSPVRVGQCALTVLIRGLMGDSRTGPGGDSRIRNEWQQNGQKQDSWLVL